MTNGLVQHIKVEESTGIQWVNDIYKALLNTINTVYQRTPDIAISEVKECLQGLRTRSVFLDLLFVFCDL